MKFIYCDQFLIRKYYDKTFEVFEPEEHQDNCSVTFNYFEKNRSNGFPFKYFISAFPDAPLMVNVTPAAAG